MNANLTAGLDPRTRLAVLDVERRQKALANQQSATATDVADIEGDITTLQGDVATLDLKAAAVRNTYTPTLSNVNVGTGGSAANSARYVFVGGEEVGDYGILQVSGRLVLGTSGASMGTGPTATLPAGFSMDLEVATGAHRLGVCTAISSIGWVQRASGTEVAFVVAGAAATYVNNASITSSVPGTWGAGDAITYNFSVGVVRT